MEKFKKYLSNLIRMFLVVLVSVTLFAALSRNAESVVNAEIPSSSTGFTPFRDTSEEHVYYLFRTQDYEFTAGREIMFIGGTGLENTMVVPKVPAGSARLRITSGGKAYITDSITCYVDVIERGNGFDWCETGTLNYNATEYSCSYSGVQHYKGAAFNYSTKLYYNTARIGVFNNNNPLTNKTVQLFDGNMYFPLNNEGNGYYSSTTVYNGEYEIIVDGQHTGQPLVINKFTIGDNGTLSGEIFYSGNTYTENVYYYDMEVKTYLDGNLSNVPGDVYLKSACTNCALKRTATGTYQVSYIMKESSVREAYSVLVGGKDTGYTLNDNNNSSFKNRVSIYYHTLSVNITADSPWTNANVELRNDDGEVRSVLKYLSTSGNTTTYTNFMQKDEASAPEEMTVFVDYVATDQSIYSVRPGAIGAESDLTFANLTYYDITVNLRLNNSAFTLDYPVLITNGVNSYSMTSGNGTIGLRVRQIISNNQELPYVVTVTGVTDNLEPLALSLANKTVTINYYTFKFISYNFNGTNATQALYRTQYVRKESAPSLVSDPYVSGMTFDKWSLTTWSQNENLDNIESYNFSNTITAPVNVYAHFAKTEVKINDSFVKCTVSGAQSSTGVAFRMANVAISGFEKGNNSIKSMLLNLTNVDTVYFYSTSGKTYKQGQNANLTSVSGGYSANQSAVSIVFNNKVSMAVAQDYIRNYVVIKPVVNQDVQVTLTVSDGVLSTNATTSVTQTQWGGTAWTVKAAGTYSSWAIGSGNGVQYVYFTGNATFNGSTGQAGISISGTCYIYIPSGVTVTCNGGAGSGKTGGGAGVYLPSGSTLNVLGNGTLVAKGGNAGNGSKGANGGGGWKSGSTYGSGSGGAGGAGGGGAGAGIGTNGATGGNGGSGGSGGSVGWSSKGKAQFWGQAGAGGSQGGTPAACGTFNKVSTVTVTANGGSKGSNGGAGSAGGYQTDKGTGWKYNHCAAGGGGGGGGGAGYAGNSIGAGGAGGGGGGGGGSGACDYHSNTDYNCIGGGKGGYGGYGASGQASRGGNAHCDHQDVPGGNGGGAGSAGNAGSSKSATSFTPSTSTNTKWTVTFTGATSNGTQEYSFESSVITVPDYVPSGKNLFLGWRVETYAKNPYGGSSSRPLTTAENVLYQPGEKITTALGTYGNVVLKAVTMPYEGKIAQDKLDVAKKYFASSNPTNPTYYNYKVQTYLDGVAANVGSMVFTIGSKSYKVESSASTVGLYSLTLETNVATFTAKIDGVSVQGTLSKTTTNRVDFESMKVKITGHGDVQSVVLSGAGAPILQKDDTLSTGLTTVYSAIKQKNLDTNYYGISVNGEAIPAETARAKYGTEAVINYSTAFVSLDTNMAIEHAELIDASGNCVPLRKQDNNWIATKVLDTDTVYNVYANGFDTKVTVKFNSASVLASAKIYEFKLVTRIDNVVSPSIAKLTVNGKATTMKTQESLTKSGPSSTEYWSYVVVDDAEVEIESNGQTVTSVTPNADLNNTYIDYYTVRYANPDTITGNAPVDENIYLAGDTATILSYNNLKAPANTYLSGWTSADKNFKEGDTTTVNAPITLTAVCTSDLLQVHFVDYFSELEVRSHYSLADKLAAYDGDRALEKFVSYGRQYELKGWVLDIDPSKNIYASGEETDFVAGEILGDSEEVIDVYFNAVYNVTYLNDIHFELLPDAEDGAEVSNTNEDGTKNYSLTRGIEGETFTVNYNVRINKGVSAILLIPQYDKNIFKIKSVTTKDDTVLGSATLSENYDVDVFKIAFDNTVEWNETGVLLFSVTYEIINPVAGKYADFGLVLDYPEDTLTDVDNLLRSNAWLIITEPDHSAYHHEVKIFVDNEIAVIIQTPGTITIADQVVVYYGEALTVGDIYSLASAFDSEATYYEFVAGEFVEATEVTEENFDEKHYYVLNTTDDVLYDYSGFGQQAECIHPAEFTIKWYTREGDVYTEISAPKNVGEYYVGVSSTTSDYVYAVAEVKGFVRIVPAEVTYQIHDKTSAWNAEIVALTGEVSEGVVYEGDDLQISLSTTATSNSPAGEYAITGEYDNANYNVTFVDGVYTITKKQIELGLDATAKFLDGSFAYDGTEKNIYVTINNFYQDILTATYTGGEANCSGNGAIHVLFNNDNEVIGYEITATFAITEDYQNKVEFVTDEDSNLLNTLQATLTITIHALTQSQVDELVSQFVEFSVVDGQTKHVLTPTNENHNMNYDKDYDAIFEYAKVVVNTVKDNVVNDKISPIVTYKLDEIESVQFDASEEFDYSEYMVKNANTYVVSITFVPGNGYAFDVEVNPTYTITMTIAKLSLTINASAEVSYDDNTPNIIIDNGTGWLDGENYALYDITSIQNYNYLVLTTYVKGQNAGTAYDLSWDESADDVLSEVLCNYELTLTVTNGTVNKKIININDYIYDGYSALYDAADHTLVVYRHEDVVAANDPLVSYTITIGQIEKDVVRNYSDSGEYTATLTLRDPDNYIFGVIEVSDEEEEEEPQEEPLQEPVAEVQWTLSQDKASATLTRDVVIAKVTLVIGIEYTKSTASFSLSTFSGNEDESVLTDFTYLLDGVSCDSTITATAAGEFTITAQSTNENYLFSIENVTVYEVSFAYTDTYDQDVAGSGYLPHNMPASQFIFAGLDLEAIEPNAATGVFTADLPQEVPTLRHYTFDSWSNTNSQKEQFDFAETIIQGNTVIYTWWAEKPTYTITYEYRIEDQEAWNNLDSKVYHSDDELIYGDTLLLLPEVNWFVGDNWYYDKQLSNVVFNNIYLNADITLYGHYRFDLGYGDVNGDRNVNANDITLYRQWIVGGYEMNVVEVGDEWSTVTGTSFNTNNTYFVKRVADCNVPLKSSVVFGDGSLDIRDVSTIRMALVGGYGFDVVSGVEATGESVVIISVSEIDSISKLLVGISSGKKVKISKDINEESAVVEMNNLQKNVVIDLNGLTITVPSFSLSLANGFDGRIEIYNGSIVAEGGISLTAPSGTIILNNVTLYDKDGEFTLQAANHSLHFKGAVEFLKDDGNNHRVPADVVIPSTTHVVLESQSTLTIKNIVVQEVTGSTLSIEINNSQSELISVQGNFTAEGDNANIVDNYDTVKTNYELVEAARKGFDVRLGANITVEEQVAFTGNATLDLNGYNLTVQPSGIGLKALIAAVNGARLMIVGEGVVTSTEATVMAFYGSTVIIESGTFNATDNFVVGTNGTVKANDDQGHNTIIINGGTFNGGIQSAGYVACGIYVANSDTVVVNGGTFNVTNGCGILARSGNTTVNSDVVFNVTGDSHLGKVGDSHVTVPAGKVLVLDLKANYPGGTPILNNNTSYEVYVVVDGTYTFVHSASEFNAARGSYANVILAADLYECFTINSDMNIHLNGHTIDTRTLGYSAVAASNGAKVTINGEGNVKAREGCVLVVNGSQVAINGGTYTCTDNFVVGTNGTVNPGDDRGHNTITINGGTFNGEIISAGYVACGIYVANSDTVVVNGGTFNVTNGVGILARSGNTTVNENVVFNVTGNGTLGKVGDSQVTVPSGEVLVVDYAANYPGGTPTLTNNTNYEVYALVDDKVSLTAAFGYADKIILAANINYGEDDIVTSRTVTLDLNGHDLVFDGWGLEINAPGTLTINATNGGTLRAAEAALFAQKGGNLVVNGGTFISTNNFVVGTHGSEGRGGSTITIHGGTFNGSMSEDGQAHGYVACGIYAANNNTIVVNGGTFNVANGVGILARSGNTTVNGGTFNVSGNGTLGKVGDSQVTVPSGEELVLDLKANYPGGTPTLVNNTAYVIYTVEAE